MAYINQQQRDHLRNELLQLSYNKAKGRINRIDPNSRLRYWRNAQRTGEWHTAYDMPALGVTVALVETIDPAPTGERIYKRSYNFVDVRVDPLPENKD